MEFLKVVFLFLLSNLFIVLANLSVTHSLIKDESIESIVYLASVILVVVFLSWYVKLSLFWLKRINKWGVSDSIIAIIIILSIIISVFLLDFFGVLKT